MSYLLCRIHVAPNFVAQYFREFRDLTSDHENFTHENLALLWVWLHSVCIHMHIAIVARVQ